MIKNIDECINSFKDGEYGGASGLKEGVIINDENWLIKYPKNTTFLAKHEEMLYTNSSVSEYLGSNIYKILGFPVHETLLVERKNKIAVACKDFLDEDERLVEIRTLKNSANNDMAEKLEMTFSSTSSSHVIDFEEMQLHLKHNHLISRINGINERFFDQIVVDAYINNNDRNDGNWGIIRSKNKEDCLAPIYDNGASFNRNTPDSRLEKMLNNEKVKKENYINGISIYGKCKINEGKSINYYNKNLLKFDNEYLKNSLCKIVPIIEKNKYEINYLIDSIDEKACSKIRKQFYKESLECRLENILIPAYEIAIENNIQNYKENCFYKR